jgi:hypothetical protein
MVGASIVRSTANASFPFFGPERSRLFALLTVELVGHPDQRTEDSSAIIAGQLHDPGLDDETAEFDQMPRAPAALVLPCAHVMPRPCRLMPVVRRSVACPYQELDLVEFLGLPTAERV